MATWQAPVFDRTRDDVRYAKQQLARKVNDTELKGCFNVTDINRIENNTSHLADALTELYYITHISKGSTWYYNSLIYQSDVNRIINNINLLLIEYCKPHGSVDLPNTLTTFEQANAIEKNLFLIKEMLDNMVSSFKECDTFECGEE